MITCYDVYLNKESKASTMLNRGRPDSSVRVDAPFTDTCPAVIAPICSLTFSHVESNVKFLLSP